MLVSICSCAPGVLRSDPFCNDRVIALELVKICTFQLVCSIAPKVFYLVSWNFTEMLVSMSSCAPGVSHSDHLSNDRVIVLELVKIGTFQLVFSIAPKVFDLEPWNFTEMLVSMCSCAPGVSHSDPLSNDRVIVLELVKIGTFQLVFGSWIYFPGWDFKIPWHSC